MVSDTEQVAGKVSFNGVAVEEGLVGWGSVEKVVGCLTVVVPRGSLHGGHPGNLRLNSSRGTIDK